MSNTVECPMCFKNFSSNFISSHVQSCNGLKQTENSKKRKTSLTISTPPSKVKKPNAAWSKSKTVSTAENSCKLKSSNGFFDKPSPSNSKKSDFKPLAELARPTNLESYFGQNKSLGVGSALLNLLKSNKVPSMILWGPPGCGKTTLAHIIANNVKEQNSSATRFVKMSATNTGKADAQAFITAAKNEQKMFKRKTILFVDEIHRFNKLQQDTFLPHVENGSIILIGATTENPSFALNSALLSRCRVVVLDKLEPNSVKDILVNALRNCYPDAVIRKDIAEVQDDDFVSIEEDAILYLANLSDGDARYALNGLQIAIEMAQADHDTAAKNKVTTALVKSSLQRSHILYDKTGKACAMFVKFLLLCSFTLGDQHYHMASALQKSIRGSDDNAALYWLTRMMMGGEDPKFLARRLVRMASEDIGIADPNALNIAVSAYSACQYVGMPECDVILAECAVYLARAPKSPEIYLALAKVKDSIQNYEGNLPGVPLHLRNASTKLAKSLGYGKGYDHANQDQQFLPDEIVGVDFFSNRNM